MSTQFPLGYSVLDDTTDNEKIRETVGFPNDRVGVFISRLSPETVSVKIEVEAGSIKHMLYFTGIPEDDLGFKKGYRIWVESVGKDGAKLSFYKPETQK